MMKVAATAVMAVYSIQKDKGISWKSINKGLPPGIHITTLLVHKNEVYAGTDFGAVFKLVSGK